MEGIRKQCILLRSLIADTLANRFAIGRCVRQIEDDMRKLIDQGYIPYATADVSFEGLCFAYFNHLYQESDFYVLRQFIVAFAPFHNAGLMRVKNNKRTVPHVYIHRFMILRALMRSKQLMPKARPKPSHNNLLADELMAANALYQLSCSS